MSVLRVRRLGRVRYDEASVLQHALAARGDDYLLALEHPPVYTLGVRTDPAHMLVDPASVGAAVCQADRGCDVTYHGPGQLVLYPIVTLPDGPGAGPAHVQRIEQAVIDALGDLGMADVGRLAGYPGIWVGVEEGRPRKVAAIGVRAPRLAGRRRTLHGVALNVDVDLTMFDHIVPCGIGDYPVTSLAAEGLAVGMEEVTDAVLARAVEAWGQGRGVEEATVSAWSAQREVAGSASERPLFRRLRDAGVDPDQGLALGARKPPWLRIPARMGGDYLSLGRTIHDLGLVTVCEEAGCPNIYECWADGTATFMINGSRCTRACGFCLVDTRHPLPLDPG